MTAITQPMAIAKRRRSPRAGRLALHITIGILMFIWLLPTLGMLVNSFRPAADGNAGLEGGHVSVRKGVTLQRGAGWRRCCPAETFQGKPP